jgi:gliding motility-associated-like protein
LILLSEMMNAQDLPYGCANGSARYRIRGQPGSNYKWTIAGGRLLAQYGAGDSIDVKWQKGSGNHSLSCQEFVIGGCSTTPITSHVEVIIPEVDLGKTLYFCEGQTVKLNAGDGFTGYLWQDGSRGSSLEATAPGLYWVEVIQGKCKTRDSVQVVRAASPMVYLGRDTSLCSYEKLLLDAGNSGMSYEWSTGSQDQTIWAGEGDGLIWVRVTNKFHCTSSKSIYIKPCLAAFYILIPNVFTPNGDGINDVWEIYGIENYPETMVTLFDRWGRLVFKSEPGYPKPWSGMRDSKLLPMDAYYYIIDLKNGSENLRGSVTLIQ